MPAAWVNEILPTFLADNPFLCTTFDDTVLTNGMTITDHGSGNNPQYLFEGTTLGLPTTEASTAMPASDGVATGWEVNLGALHNQVASYYQRVMPLANGDATWWTPASNWTAATMEAVCIPYARTNGWARDLIAYGQSDAAGRRGLVYGNDVNDNWRMWMGGYADTDPSTVVNKVSLAGTKVQNGVFEHRVVTWDGSTGDIKHYLNGVADGTDTTTINYLNYFQGRQLFIRAIGSYSYWHGVVFLVAIYPTVLSSTNVGEHWAAVNTIPVAESLNHRKFFSMFF